MAPQNSYVCVEGLSVGLCHLRTRIKIIFQISFLARFQSGHDLVFKLEQDCVRKYCVSKSYCLVPGPLLSQLERDNLEMK